MPALGRQVVDVRVQRFGDSQTVQREQCDQGAVAEVAETGLDEEGTEFVAIEAKGA